MIHTPDGLIWPQFADYPHVGMCITTATASWGQSQAGYQRLNLAKHVDDDAVAVAHNRRRLLQRLPAVRAVQWLQQTHSTDVVEACGGVVTLPADASVTRQLGLACAVLTADCLPILLTDGEQVAAVHAGWRGLVDGIIERSLAHFRDPGCVQACIGPAIGQLAFEIGPEVAERLGAQEEALLMPGKDGRWLADLAGIAKQRLLQLGVERVFNLALCTYSDNRFYSYRRQARTGRLASLIWLSDSNL